MGRYCALEALRRIEQVDVSHARLHSVPENDLSQERLLTWLAPKRLEKLIGLSRWPTRQRTTAPPATDPAASTPQCAGLEPRRANRWETAGEPHSPAEMAVCRGAWAAKAAARLRR